LLRPIGRSLKNPYMKDLGFGPHPATGLPLGDDPVSWAIVAMELEFSGEAPAQELFRR
jgi:hypothetical protein